MLNILETLLSLFILTSCESFKSYNVKYPKISHSNIVRLNAFRNDVNTRNQSTRSLSTKNIPSQLRQNQRKNIDFKSESSDGIRINKCLLGLSRRAADDAISEGRVTINGKVVTQAGIRVSKGNVVQLDGKVQHWQSFNSAKSIAPAKVLEERQFVYLKYWKPVGVTW